MLRQRGTVRERLLARPAPVRPFARVRSHVRRNTGALREAPITNGTPERFLARVRADVCGQVGRLREALVAVRAAVRPFARVCAQVRLERAGPCVRLAAESAKIWLAVTACRTVTATAAAVLLFVVLANGRCPLVDGVRKAQTKHTTFGLHLEGGRESHGGCRRHSNCRSRGGGCWRRGLMVHDGAKVGRGGALWWCAVGVGRYGRRTRL